MASGSILTWDCVGNAGILSIVFPAKNLIIYRFELFSGDLSQVVIVFGIDSVK